VVAWVEIIALILIALALIAGTVLTSRHDSSGTPSRRVRVESGQTLWSLAAEHPVEGSTTEQTAEAIARLNGLKGGRLVAGTSVRVPAESADDLMLACR
jgi:Tfp pilus assembly protein FimV